MNKHLDLSRPQGKIRDIKCEKSQLISHFDFFSAIIELVRELVITVDPSTNNLASARQKKDVGDKKSLVTGMSFCCKICGCGGWFNVGLMTATFTHH